MTFEGDKVVRSGETSGSNAPIANAKKLWPGGLIEYKFYRTLSRCLVNQDQSQILTAENPPSEKRVVMKQAMEYITSKTPCVTFVPGNSSSINYVIITPGWYIVHEPLSAPENSNQCH